MAFLTLLSSFLAVTVVCSVSAVFMDPVSRQGYTYIGKHGPPNWKKKFSKCGGNSQSPIDITPSIEVIPNNPIKNAPQPRLKFSKLHFEEKPFSWKLECKPPTDCGSTKFNGKTFKLNDLHFHHRSEHKIRGQHFPLEMHLVHKAGGAEAVVSVLFQHGSPNKEFERILTARESGAGDVSVDLSKFIARKNGYYVYSGSLTTPPCDEGVTWMVSKHRVTISKSQVERFKKTAGIGKHGNNRPVQPINGRKVAKYGHFK